MRAVLADRKVRRYLLAQVLSLFGDTTLWLAVGIWVKQITGSSSAAGLVFFFYLVPYAFAPLAGMLVDRLRRRPLLAAVNLASAVVVLALLFVHGRDDVWLVYLVIFLYGVSGTLISSAQSALLATLLPESLLADANGLLQTGREALRLFAPLIGAGVVAATGSAAPVAVFDAVTFVVAGVVLARLPVDETVERRGSTSWWDEISAGARHVFGTPALRHVVVGTGIALLVLGFGETVVFPVAQHGMHRSPSFVGVLVSLIGAGAAAGGLLAPRLIRRLGDGPTVALGLLVLAAADLAQSSGAPAAIVSAMLVVGVGSAFAFTGWSTAIQSRTPAHLQGRAYSAADTTVTVPQTASVAIGAALVSLVDYRILLVVMAAVTAVASAYLFTRRVDWRVGARPGAPPVPVGADTVAPLPQF